MYEEVLNKVQAHVETLDSLEDWLFVAVNTMKAIVTNSAKGQEPVVLKAAECKNTSEVQRFYDRIQGMYGREGFSYRNHPKYYYLSSLIAIFPAKELSDDDREFIRKCYEAEEYLLYS